MKQPLIYLDYAAATPADKRVLAAMQPYLTEKFYNPSATYWPAHEVAKDLAAVRGRVAHWFGARPSEIIFTAGGTEANNLVIHGVMRKFSDSNVVVSAIEHDAVLRPAQQYDCHEVAVDLVGLLRLDDLRAKIDDKTVLVSIMYANNEIGTIEPLREVAKIITEVREHRHNTGNTLPLYFHSDAAQAAGYLDLHAARLGVDLLSVNAGKIYGPKQVGALYIKAGTMIEPQIFGGGQERNLRSGTENVAGAIGLATALDLVQETRSAETKRLQALQQQFFAGIEQQFPSAVINGSRKKRLPNNIHVTFPGQDNERLLIQLDEAGILAAAGSACSASSNQASHVLAAIGISESQAQASLRFSMGQATNQAMIEQTLATLAQLLA